MHCALPLASQDRYKSNRILLYCLEKSIYVLSSRPRKGSLRRETADHSIGKYLTMECIMTTSYYEEDFRPPGEDGLSIFNKDGERENVWICFLIVMLYCCLLPEGKYRLCLRHGFLS